MREELDRPADALLARVAARQHGIVTTAQLAAAGIDKSGVTRRVRAGRLHRVHRGVFAVGYRGLSQHGRWMAAVLACGEGAALSHSSAAVLWGFLRPFDGPVHLTSPSTNGRASKRYIVLHRSPSLKEKGMVTLKERIPVTTPRRTIEDLPATVPDYRWRRAKRQAEFLGYELGLPTDRSRSDLERDFLRFLTQQRFPRPEVNVKVGNYEVDFLWRQEKLVIETDFFDYHRGSIAFEDDHQREMELRRQGYTVRRYTGAQLDNHPAEIVVELGEVLGQGRVPAS